MKTLLSIWGIITLLCILPAQAQYLSRGGGPNQDEALDIATDASGNSYVTGYFSSTITFPGGISLSSSGLSDIFVLKANPNGQILWAVKAGGTADERGTSIAVDGSGNVYVTGHFQGTANFGVSSVTSNGSKDMFVAKYNTAGVLQWVNSGGGTGEDFGYGLAVDGAGNVAVTGEFKNTGIFGSNSFVAGGTDVFVCRYTNAGALSWAKAGSGADNARGIDIACDASGNVYVTGQFSNNITFDNTESNNMYNAVFLVKFNSAGNEQWLRKIEGGATNIAYGICTDANSNIYLTGDFTGNLVFFPNATSPLTSPYANKVFLVKYNTQGVIQWTKAAGSNNSISSRSVAVGSGNEVYIGGWFTCKLSQYADVYGQGVFNSVGFRDGFISKFNTAGNWEWARNFGGTGHDYLNGLAVGSGGLPVAAASFYENINIPKVGSTNVPVGIFQSGGMQYCNQADYSAHVHMNSQGAADFVFGNMAYQSNEPFDYYERSLFLGNCVRDQMPICVGRDDIYASALWCPDSVVFCGSGTLDVETRTSYVQYNYLWSNGSVGATLPVSTTGMYGVTITSKDNCFSRSDSVHVTVNPAVLPQQIWDDHSVNTPGIGINTHVTNIKICPPDTILLTGIPIAVDTFYWQTFATGYTLINDSVLQVTQGGDYHFKVKNVYGCEGYLSVKVIAYPSLPQINPYLYFSGNNGNDSLSICANQKVYFGIKDSVMGLIPCNSSSLITQVTVPQLGLNYNATVPCYGNNTGLHGVTPTQSGWLQVIWSGIYVNYCDTVPFSVSDSIYVTVHPNPVINVAWSGTTNICPGDSALFIATGLSNLSFTGNNIVTGSGTDSAWVVGAGILYLQGDSVSPAGCSASYGTTIYVNNFIDPVLTSNPANALICPNDSVQLMVTGGPSYEWFGPQGLLPQNTQSIYVTLPGFYYCAVTDTGSCQLFSNTLEVKQYTTPFLLASPSPMICELGDTALIYVVTNIGSTIQWNAPFSGSDTSQVVNSPGVYSATITSCGITTIAEITIDTSTVSSEIITTAGLIFCDRDSVVLEANGNGVAYYIWNPGNHIGQQYVVFDGGIYSVTGVDQYGCTFQSPPIEVIVTPNHTVPPTVADTMFCAPTSLTIQAFGQGTIVWFADSVGGAPLDSGSVFQTPVLSGTTVYYVMNRYDDCSSLRTPVTLIATNCEEIVVGNIFTPNGDGINDFLVFDIYASKCFHAEIYNRWGKKVFETEDAQSSWNGNYMNSNEPLTDGVYFYVIEFCPQNGGMKAQKGTVTIIRN